MRLDMSTWAEEKFFKSKEAFWRYWRKLLRNSNQEDTSKKVFPGGKISVWGIIQIITSILLENSWKKCRTNIVQLIWKLKSLYSS
jgi:hypothetical protein